MSRNQLLTITPEKLMKAAEEWRAETDLLEKEFIGVRETVARTSGYWQGAGGESYRQGVQTDTEDTMPLIGRLKRKSQMMLDMAGVYRSSEATNKARAGNLRADILR